MNEDYDGRQYLGMDPHRRRSVLVRMTETGEVLERVRIVNDRDRLAAVIANAGTDPEVVLEATYGWYWAADELAALGAQVHLAYPLGVKVEQQLQLLFFRGATTQVRYRPGRNQQAIRVRVASRRSAGGDDS